MATNDQFVKAAQAAQNALIEKVYNPVFFTTLNQLGIPVTNQKEASNYLKMASVLLEHAKKAGFAINPDPPSPELIKAAMQYMRQDKLVKNAAMVYSKLRS